MPERIVQALITITIYEDRVMTSLKENPARLPHGEIADVILGAGEQLKRELATKLVQDAITRLDEIEER